MRWKPSIGWRSTPGSECGSSRPRLWRGRTASSSRIMSGTAFPSPSAERAARFRRGVDSRRRRGVVCCGRRGSCRQARATLTLDSLDSVVIIGAYGGDHIGDAAILGGTLLGLNRRYAVTRATVMSGRPEHTRRLAAGISTPVRVDVAPYRSRDVKRALAGADALVLGGGPLYGSPRVLARHLAAVAAARKLGLPFIVERIGMSRFGDPLTRWAGRRVLRSAARIAVRTSSLGSPPVAGRPRRRGRPRPGLRLPRRSTGAGSPAAQRRGGGRGPCWRGPRAR